MKKKYKVILSKFAEKQLERLPRQIWIRFKYWSELVELNGLPNTRIRPGYHDEPLKGDRAGQRSVRLNRSYRVIYSESDELEICIVGVIEVNKHEY